MQLSREVQQEIMERFQALTPNETKYLDEGIDKNAALVLLYNIIPEADSVLMAGLPALKGHQLDPDRLLHGAVTGQAEFTSDQSPEGQPPMGPEQGGMPMGPPQGGALPMPMEQGGAMPEEIAMMQGALGGLPVENT
tara:strand:+ start:1104 stop:1514 length:411 start_codon:yes stop_codon:yes gene_type:complete